MGNKQVDTDIYTVRGEELARAACARRALAVQRKSCHGVHCSTYWRANRDTVQDNDPCSSNDSHHHGAELAMARLQLANVLSLLSEIQRVAVPGVHVWSCTAWLGVASARGLYTDVRTRVAPCVVAPCSQRTKSQEIHKRFSPRNAENRHVSDREEPRAESHVDVKEISRAGPSGHCLAL